MLHLVEACDRAAAGGGDPVDLGLRMASHAKQEGCGAPRRLSREQHGLLRVESDLDTALGGRADRAKEEGDSAGARRRGAHHQLLVDDESSADRVEQGARLSQRGAGALIGRQAGHGLADLDRRVRHRANHRDRYSQLFLDIRYRGVRHDRDDDVPIRIQHISDLAPQRDELLGLNSDQERIGSSHRFPVIGPDVEPLFRQRLESGAVPPGDRDLSGGELTGGHPASCQGLSDVPTTQDGQSG